MNQLHIFTRLVPNC